MLQDINQDISYESLTRDELDGFFNSNLKGITEKNLPMGDCYLLLNQLMNLLNNPIKKYEIDSSFIKVGRKQFLTDQIINLLKKDEVTEDDIHESLYYLLEISSNDYPGDIISIARDLNISRQEVFELDSKYREKGTICFQEKELLLNICELIIGAIKFYFNIFDYLFQKYGFAKVQDDSKKIRIVVNGNSNYFPYETNKKYLIPNTDIIFAITEHSFFINKGFYSPLADGFAEALRVYYTGQEPMRTNYRFDGQIRIKTDDGYFIEASIENSN